MQRHFAQVTARATSQIFEASAKPKGMAEAKGVYSEPRRILVPILATQLVGQFHRLLRELGETLEKRRGQPPKRALAAAKVLYQWHPEAAIAASTAGLDRNPTIVGVGNGARGDTGTSRSAVEPQPDGVLDLDEAAAAPIAEAIDALEDWLNSGQWADAALDADATAPALLTLIESTVEELLAAHAIGSSVSALMAQYQDVIAWAQTYIDQRPPDTASRDELVLLTAARLRIIYQERAFQQPARATALLSRPTDRLDQNWADETAPGVRTFSKGHFGNDQAQFNDVCRAMVIDLLHRASDKNAGKVVYIASTIFNHSDGWLKAEFDQKISDCLAAGWRVVHVLGNQGDEGSGVTSQVQADFATHLMSDLETKGIYVPTLSEVEQSTDMVLVEGVGAVVFPSIGFAAAHDAGSKADPPSPAMAVRCITGRGGSGDGPAATPIVAELRAEARALYPRTDSELPYLDKRVLPFGYRIPTENLRWFDRQMTASELLEGDRYALKPWLPTSTLPDHVAAAQFRVWEHQLDLLRRGAPDLDGLSRGWTEARREEAATYIEKQGWDWIVRSLNRLQAKRAVRHFGFETNIAEYRYRDCILRSSIVDYLEDEDPWLSANPVYGPGGLTIEQRHEHMLYLANQLEQTRVGDEMLVGAKNRVGYNLGLVDDRFSQPYDIRESWWLATRSLDRRADQVHYLHQRNRTGQAYVATLKQQSVVDFNAVETFMAVFDGIWYSIDLSERMPEFVRDFILDSLPPDVRRGFKHHSPDGVAR